jgi:hypothetical protein
MHRGLVAVGWWIVACSASACAALTGLDQIREDACMPDLCVDASAPDVEAIARDSSSDSDSAATTETTTPSPDGAPPEGAADGWVDSALRDAVSEAALEADADAGVDDATPPADSCGTVFFQDSFGSTTSGWTLDTAWSIGPECESPPAPAKGNPDPTADHTRTPGSGVVGAYLCGNNPTGTTTPFRYATSPAVDASGAASLHLGFWRWLNTDASGWMASTVDVWDGTTWVNVYENPSAAGQLVSDAAWSHQDYDVTAWKNASLQVRFGYSIVDAGVYAMSSWNVDDVTISSLTCP